MPVGATLKLSDVEYHTSEAPLTPLDRPKCGQCRSCCGGCGYSGFDNLDIEYVDGSVPRGSCMNYTIPGC